MYCLTALGKLEGFIKQQKRLDFYRTMDVAMTVKVQYPLYPYHIPYVFHHVLYTTPTLSRFRGDKLELGICYDECSEYCSNCVQ